MFSNPLAYFTVWAGVTPTQMNLHHTTSQNRLVIKRMTVSNQHHISAKTQILVSKYKGKKLSRDSQVLFFFQQVTTQATSHIILLFICHCLSLENELGAKFKTCHFLFLLMLWFLGLIFISSPCIHLYSYQCLKSLMLKARKLTQSHISGIRMKGNEIKGLRQTP